MGDTGVGFAAGVVDGGTLEERTDASDVGSAPGCWAELCDVGSRWVRDPPERVATTIPATSTTNAASTTADHKPTLEVRASGTG
jgi:hypothetical protein